MINNFHFLRPYWLLCLIPLLLLFFYQWRRQSGGKDWQTSCDAHLLPHLLKNQSTSPKRYAWWLILASALFQTLSLAGPSWVRLSIPTYQAIAPRVFLLDMSENMLSGEVSPNRLARAKFQLQDFLTIPTSGQFGLIVYTQQPFVTSPLTQDTQTILALLPDLVPNILPIQGNNLASALQEGAKLINQAGYQQGELLVLTATPPDKVAIQEASYLAKQGIHTSVLPITLDNQLPFFKSLVEKGDGQMLTLATSALEKKLWLNHVPTAHYIKNQDNIPLWNDEGRWFLLPALLFLLPVFRQGWLSRMLS